MKIRFNKKTLYSNLGLVLLWTALGIYNLIDDENLRWSDYILIGLGILYISHFLNDIINQYLKIEGGTIKKNILSGFVTKIDLVKINSIENSAGNYYLRTDSKKLKIKIDLIEHSSLLDLKNVLANLDLTPENTPFTNNGYHN